MPHDVEWQWSATLERVMPMAYYVNLRSEMLITKLFSRVGPC
jgi:hypothetical protein